jgi:N-acetylmuramoyl-L-alanine amidase
MKATIFLSTLLLICAAWSLPKLNNKGSLAPNLSDASPALAYRPVAGKIIKAVSNGADFLKLPANTGSSTGFLTGHDSCHNMGDSLAVPEITISKRKGSVGVRTVVIDPGHGGHDPGCHGVDSKEKNICLAVGKYFAEALQKNYPDLKVIMTRSTDVFIPLNERAAIATRNKADLFISIHCNAIVNASGTMGTETYVLGLHATEANLEVAKRENESILLEKDYEKNYDGYDPNSPEAHIILSMFQNAFLEQSLSFADKVQQHSYKVSSRKNRGVKQAGFLVLRHATMPSVLVETGFLTNRKEENFLRTKNGQKSMANALLLAFSDYKQEMEGGALAPVALLETDSSEEKIAEDLADDEVKADTEQVFAKPVKQETNTPAATNIKPEKNKTQPTVAEPKPESAKPHQPDLPVSLDASPAARKKSEGTSGNAKIMVEKPVAESVSNADNLISQSTDIQYRVQLAASPKRLDVSSGKWSEVEYLIQVIEENGLFKYQVVNFATQEDASTAKTKLRAKGFSDAFVVTYQNGVRIK